MRNLRDKLQREGDFLVVRDRKPWRWIEVKKGATALSPALGYYRAALGAPHASQAVIDLPGDGGGLHFRLWCRWWYGRAPC